MQSSLSLTGGAPGEAATADLSGRCVGNSYVLVCPVGHGATGTVWRGIDRSTGAPVAVKLLHEGLLRQPKLVIRFVQERTILMMLRHENIVGVHDLFSVGGSLALVMDYVAGGSLRARLTAVGTLPPAEAARLLAQVAAALAQAHGLGVIHRDVKPDNILLQRVDDPRRADERQSGGRRGDERRADGRRGDERLPGGLRGDERRADGRYDVRLTDFGIARVLDAAGLTTPQAIVGTPHYMAPEAIRGEAEPASDVYSAGVVLYELVTGHPPYAGGEPLAVLRKHVEEEPECPPGLPQPVWDVIAWCLDKDPARRPAADELGAALRELAGRMDGVPALTAFTEAGTPSFGATANLGPPGHPSQRQPARRRPRNGPRSWKWRRPGMLVTLIAAAVALSGLGGFNAWRLLGIPEAPATARNPAAPGAVAAGPSAPVSGSAPALPGASVPATEGIRQVTASGGGPAGTAAAGQAAGTVRPGVSVGVSAGPGRAGGGAAVAFGPWRCGDAYSWELGHPVLARPCHALGPAVRVSGEMEAPPGVQADVSLTVRDAVTDEVAAGPYVCRGLMFTDFALKQTCGPTDLSPPRGGRYVVAESWQYTERPLLPGGSARGPAFDW